MLLNEINKLAFIIAPVFWNLVYRSIVAVVIGFIWLGICKVLEKFFNPNSKNLLTLFLLLSLIGLPHHSTGMSVMEYAAPIQNIFYREEYDLYRQQLFLQEQAEQSGESSFSAPTPVLREKAEKLYIKSLVFDVVLPLIWLAGVIAGTIWIIFTAVNFNNKLKKGHPADKRISDIYQRLLKIIHRNYRIPIIVTDTVSSPATTGWIKKKILLPEYITGLEDDTIEFVLLHELCHIKEWHLGYTYILLILQVIYWFNPLLHILFRENKQNMELMADMEVLEYTDNHNAYTQSMLKILSSRNENEFSYQVLCMADSIKNMKKRIESIKQAGFFKKNSWKIIRVSTILGAFTLLVFAPVKIDKQPSQIVDSHGAMAVEKTSSIGAQSLSIYCTLPWNWSVETSKINPRPETDIPLPQSQFAYTMDIYQDDELIGYIGMSPFEPYTEEIAAEDYHKTVWPGLRLSSMCIWEPFTPILQTENGETGLTDINYVDYQYLAENPEIPVAGAPQHQTFGILAYDKQEKMYVGFAFMPDKVSWETAGKIAMSVTMRNDGRRIEEAMTIVYKQQSLELDGKKFTCALPETWTIAADDNEVNSAGIPVPLGHYGEVGVVGNIYDGDELIGRIGVNSFTPYTGEIAPEKYWETVFPPLRLSSFFQWENFYVLHGSPDKNPDGEYGLADIDYLDYTKLNDYPGRKPDVPNLKGQGVWAYDKEKEFFVCMAFIDGTVHDFTLSDIARHIRFE